MIFRINNIGEKVEPSVKPCVKQVKVEEVFPKFISESLKEGIVALDKKLNGFANSGAVLSFPETRSSSPVRIIRNDEYYSEFANWLYPSGEGAGYAGGIMSAAVDGLRCAEAIIDKEKGVF